MKVYIAKIDYFDPKTWPVLGAPYPGKDPEGSRRSISNVANKLGNDGIALLVGSKVPRTDRAHRHRLLGAVQCHMALYDTASVVHPRHLTSTHFTRENGAFRMPYCIPFSYLWRCHKPLIQAAVPCGDELVDYKNRRQWFIRLTGPQAKVALDVLHNMAAPGRQIPRPARGFISDL